MVFIFTLIFIMLAGGIFAEEPFADEMVERTVFIHGSAHTPEARDFFINNFNMEAVGLGWEPKSAMRDAAFNFQFTVNPNMVQFIDGTIARAPSGEPQYIIEIVFTRNYDNAEIVRYNFPFTDFMEMYEHNQLLFFRSIVNVPNPSIEMIERIRLYEWERGFAEGPGQGNVNQDWWNKWLYLRLSLGNPFTIFSRQLHDSPAGEHMVYSTDEAGNITGSQRIGNRIVAMPGFTIGIEAQVLDWLILEPNFRITLGDPVIEDNTIFNFSVGLSVKFPLRLINNVKFSPFVGLAYWGISQSDSFANFPPWEIGGGLEVNLRSGRRNAIFFYVSYMQTIGNVMIHNPYVVFSNPSEIPFRRSAINIGVGYKFGFINRVRR